MIETLRQGTQQDEQHLRAILENIGPDFSMTEEDTRKVLEQANILLQELLSATHNEETLTETFYSFLLAIYLLKKATQLDLKNTLEFPIGDNPFPVPTLFFFTRMATEMDSNQDNKLQEALEIFQELID